MAVLYIVATPIGNLEDVTLRALRILKEVDLILCEDTRRTKRLLNRYQIDTPTISYHQHIHKSKIDFILNQLKLNKKIALVSEAGTPGINDPGAELIRLIRQSFSGEIKIIPIPGPTALAAAFSVAGISGSKFIFLGFPPHKKKREKFFREVADSKYPVILFESPHRLIKTFKDLEKFLGVEKQIFVCRELTKKFESFYQGSVKDMLKIFKDKQKLKGEFVIITNY